MAAKKSAAKKTAAKKTSAKKTTAKRVTKKSTAKRSTKNEPQLLTHPQVVVAAADPSGVQPDESKSVEVVATEILAGSRRWNTGREQEIRLREAGFNPVEVRRAVSRIRAQRRRAEQR